MVCQKEEQLVYLHVFHYSGEGLSPSSEGDEWVGRVRIMTDKLDEMKGELKTINSKLDKILNKIQ